MTNKASRTILLSDIGKCFDSLIYDLNTSELLPTNPSNIAKLSFEDIQNGQKIGWWYRDQAKYAKSCGFDIEEAPPFIGVIVTKPNISYNGLLEIDDCIIVIHDYPCEKCYPMTHWMTLCRLLDDDKLVKIVKL